jgi:hypothetical protein
MSSIQVPFFGCNNYSKIHVFKYTEEAPPSHFSAKMITTFWFDECPLFAHWSHSLSVANVPKAVIGQL